MPSYNCYAAYATPIHHTTRLHRQKMPCIPRVNLLCVFNVTFRVSQSVLLKLMFPFWMVRHLSGKWALLILLDLDYSTAMWKTWPRKHWNPVQSVCTSQPMMLFILRATENIWSSSPTMIKVPIFVCWCYNYLSCKGHNAWHETRVERQIHQILTQIPKRDRKYLCSYTMSGTFFVTHVTIIWSEM